jgi:16S rRNA (guanine1207-N2)-methyltransferase
MEGGAQISKRDHYFTAKPRSKKQKFKVQLTLNNKNFEFFTASGMFSPRKVDLGTRVLLKNANIPDKGVIADLGCGYGIIGITISKINPSLTVHFYDINKRAIRLAKENIVLHGLKQFAVFEGDYIEKLREKGQKYDAVYINPPIKIGQDAFIPHIISAIEFLKKKSSIFIVIKRTLGAQGVLNKIKGIFEKEDMLESIEIKVKKSSGYWLIEIKKLY